MEVSPGEAVLFWDTLHIPALSSGHFAQFHVLTCFRAVWNGDGYDLSGYLEQARNSESNTHVKK